MTVIWDKLKNIWEREKNMYTNIFKNGNCLKITEILYNLLGSIETRKKYIYNQ